MSHQAACLLFLSMSILSAMGGDRIAGAPFATRSEVIARHGMAATSQPLATQIALDVLKAGGSAVDAAIAANAALGLMEPTGNGIGGDLFAIVWDAKTQKLHGLNASGRSPAGLTLETFKELKITQIPKEGALTMSVPGCVDGWFELHEKFGKLPMTDVLAPAIRYAEEGFPVSDVIATYWSSGERFKDYPGFAATFLPEGKAPGKGDTFKNPGLAATLRTLSKDGRDAFYKGDLAKKMDVFMQANDGYLRYEDFATHTSDWVEPVSADYRGHTLWELPPNGQGIAALQILNVLEGYDVAKFGYGSGDHLHYFVEAKKLAFEDRARFYSDPAFNKIPVTELISKEYGEKQRARIKDQAAMAYPVADSSLQNGDTIYLSVADKNRNMVSLIQSNFRGFGSGLCPDGLGFCIQSRGELFSLEEGHFNTYAPKKRPFHTIIPAFVTKDGKPYMSFGVMGGATQPQAHAQILMNMIDFGMNLQEAGDAARLVHTGSSQPTGETMTDGGTVYVESGFSKESLEALRARGHKVEPGSGQFGGYQAILYNAEQDVYYGASESRKDGHAAGY